jgi:hypothetical protein
LLFLSVFLVASAVEMVEALSIVVAVRVTRGRRSALVGAPTRFAEERFITIDPGGLRRGGESPRIGGPLGTLNPAPLP